MVILAIGGVGRPVRALDPGENETWVTVEQFERVLDSVAGREDVGLTFDDGNSSDVEIALPRLVERDLTAEFFPLAGRIGQRGFLDANGLRELVEAGMSIGSHGWEHRDWRRLDDRHARRELETAPKLLADLSGKPVRAYVPPFGAYDRRVLSRLRRSGATRIYTTEGGVASRDGLVRPRTKIRYDVDQEWIDGVLGDRDGLYRRAGRVMARVSRLVRF
ncbi:polysaccharide deacetylase family protein [Amycolatopsis sp. BJA-103]|uniref:polysaccharide deacetylase family protein n=1 Tax=unclassified Amycolatopsis TaxID=2618356 RepID=UPI000C77A2CC|nr:polysaccharide deacetylase family protein [Amycolatopsis sp. BJA-103]AUI63192.1 glycosyl transferase [Amycolatopsis sp. BJA-103]PNE19036.1 glycosyl transferase [Amycolatopsis sp. BJA-103]